MRNDPGDGLTRDERFVRVGRVRHVSEVLGPVMDALLEARRKSSTKDEGVEDPLVADPAEVMTAEQTES